MAKILMYTENSIDIVDIFAGHALGWPKIQFNFIGHLTQRLILPVAPGLYRNIEMFCYSGNIYIEDFLAEHPQWAHVYFNVTCAYGEIASIKVTDGYNKNGNVSRTIIHR